MDTKHYKTNKKTYYLNLRSNDALITQTPPGGVPNNYKFEWPIKNISLSRQAQLCLTSMYFQNGGTNPDATLPVVIRCNQVQNQNTYDSANCMPTIIHISNMLHTPVIENWHPISDQHLDRIELFLSNSIDVPLNGIQNTLAFYIQLKIEDYDTEEVNPRLMPSYTNDSLSYRVPMSLK
jgi:hypothetical protein